MAGDPRCEAVKIGAVIVELQTDRTGFGHRRSLSLRGWSLRRHFALPANFVVPASKTAARRSVVTVATSRWPLRLDEGSRLEVMLKNSGITPGPEGGGEILSPRFQTAAQNLKPGPTQKPRTANQILVEVAGILRFAGEGCY
jgi:hypothetical protein